MENTDLARSSNSTLPIIRFDVSTPFNIVPSHEPSPTASSLYTFLRTAHAANEVQAYWGSFLNHLHFPDTAPRDSNAALPTLYPVPSLPKLTPEGERMLVRATAHPVFHDYHNVIAPATARSDWKQVLGAPEKTSVMKDENVHSASPSVSGSTRDTVRTSDFRSFQSPYDTFEQQRQQALHPIPRMSSSLPEPCHQGDRSAPHNPAVEAARFDLSAAHVEVSAMEEGESACSTPPSPVRAAAGDGPHETAAMSGEEGLLHVSSTDTEDDDELEKALGSVLMSGTEHHTTLQAFPQDVQFPRAESSASAPRSPSPPPRFYTSSHPPAPSASGSQRTIDIQMDSMRSSAGIPGGASGSPALHRTEPSSREASQGSWHPSPPTTPVGSGEGISRPVIYAETTSSAPQSVSYDPSAPVPLGVEEEERTEETPKAALEEDLTVVESSPLLHFPPGSMHPLYTALLSRAGAVGGGESVLGPTDRSGEHVEALAAGPDAVRLAQMQQHHWETTQRAVERQIQSVKAQVQQEVARVSDVMENQEHGMSIWSPEYKKFKTLHEFLLSLEERTINAAALYQVERDEEQTIRVSHAALLLEVTVMRLLLKDVRQLAEGGVAMMAEARRHQTEFGSTAEDVLDEDASLAAALLECFARSPAVASSLR